MKARKYNGKYLLGNLLVCRYCGASYRRRTERGKVVWRCATRMEEGRSTCVDSPTLNVEWIKEILGEVVCKDSIYSEEVVWNKVEGIFISNNYLELDCSNNEKVNIQFIKNR